MYYLILFFRQKFWNSAEVNWVPLSETMISGSPNRAKRLCSSFRVAILVVEVIGITSGHLEKASTTTRYGILPVDRRNRCVCDSMARLVEAMDIACS